jgi:ParB-like chromosome segregation protein Spo0J
VTTSSVPAKLVPIERIVEDVSIQVRVQIDPKEVKAQEELIQEHGFVDGIVLYYQENQETDPLLLSDGFHRLAAYRNLGHKQVRAVLRKGDKSDALKYAIQNNCHHGARMTNADKRRAAELAVVDEKIGEMCDKEIARMIGISISLVGEVRRGETKSAKKRKVAARKQKKEAASLIPVVAHERRAPGDKRPTRAIMLAQIREDLRLDLIEEADVIALMETKSAAYRFLPKVGEKIALKVIGKAGRPMLEVPALIVKDWKYEQIILKLEDGKIGVIE